MANRAYEALLILEPSLDDDGVANTIIKLDEGIKKLGGTIEKNEKQGRKKLAYTVKKKTEGVYVLTHLQIDPQQINELNRLYKLSENTLRHMVTAR
jgi:small subunit ribosomal protein S6